MAKKASKTVGVSPASEEKGFLLYVDKEQLDDLSKGISESVSEFSKLVTEKVNIFLNKASEKAKPLIDNIKE